MSESHSSCHVCGEPATVHLTQIVDGKANKMDLCESCAVDKGLIAGEGEAAEANLPGLPIAFLSPHASSAGGEHSGDESRQEVCGHCGMGPEDFKRTGRLGCPHCYERFGEMVRKVLPNLHRGLKHTGKVPRSRTGLRVNRNRLAELQESLNEAVASERYEEAARYRDEINELKHALEHAEEQRNAN